MTELGTQGAPAKKEGRGREMPVPSQDSDQEKQLGRETWGKEI